MPVVARTDPALRQHFSHQSLLTHPSEAPPADLDAIIVPNGRPAKYLHRAIGVAKRLDVFLLLLCSRRNDASSAALEANGAGVHAIALDIDLLPASLLPRFAIDARLRRDGFGRSKDVSFKRNLGLLIAALAGWRRVLFLDDDVVVRRPEDLLAAAGLLEAHEVVGLANAGMPDNSVVCHAFRDSGGRQDTFIGGGALAVGEASFGSFFPNIYNEDWFFLLDGRQLRPTAVTGEAEQARYDPYHDSHRAEAEELGDTLAEGVYGLLDIGLGLEDANAEYWQEFLPDRRKFIRTAMTQVTEAADIDAAKKSRMISALQAAAKRNESITPDLCVCYLRDWQEDCGRWRDHLQDMRLRHRALGVEGVLEALGIDRFAHRSLG